MKCQSSGMRWKGDESDGKEEDKSRPWSSGREVRWIEARNGKEGQ